ncbi:MAG: VIT domain-containing protein, partial [Polyangiales bacterium]
IACTIGKHRLSAADSGLSVRRDGEDVTVYVARGLAILTSPGGRIEIGAGEQGTAHALDNPKLAPVAFWQDWIGGMGDGRPTRAGVGSASGRIYGMDPFAPAGTPARKLGIAKQAVRAVIREGLAETEVDQTFSNPGGQAIEGWYWFTVPPEATVTSFALETDGVLVEGEVVEKKEAAAKYAAAVAQYNDPALLEWVDGRTYRARIFPIPASGTRRVVLRYVEVLPTVEGKTRYVYPLRSTDPVRFDEFSLTADLGPEAPGRMVATSLDATVDGTGRHISMRRSGYVPRADFQIEITGNKPKSPVRAWRFEAGANQADYLMLRYVPDLDFAKLPAAKGEVVVVVDTSAGGDESSRALRIAAAEGVLRALADDDRFALVALDVTPKVVYPAAGLAPATEGDIAKALEKLSDQGVGGATDMGGMFEPALERLHGAEQPAIVYVGDGIATSGETSGEALLERLRRSMSGSRARFFSVGVGPDARHELLQQLTRAGGGQHLRIDEADQTTGQALRLASAIKTPTITDLEVDLGAGLDQPFYSATGKLARGEELMLLARTHHKLPEKVRVKGRAGGQPFDVQYPLELEGGVVTGLTPRLWASEYMRRVLGSGAGTDENRAKVLELGLEYGLMTPYTSILALDSEASYARQNIKRRNSPLRGVRLTSIENDKHEEALGCMFAPMALRPLGGCSKYDAAPSAEQKEADDKSGGTGTKAKGAEGSMGNPTTVAPGTEDKKSAANEEPPPAATTSPIAKAPPKDMDELDQTVIDAPAKSAPTYPGGAKMGVGGQGGPAASAAPKQLAGLDGGKEKGKAQQEKPAPKPYVPPKPAVAMNKALARCSDAASRPLAERLVLWQKRLKQSTQPADLTRQYELARLSCELPDFRDQSALLGLIQQKINTEQSAEIVLGYFAGQPEVQSFVARAILRRTVDVHVAAAVSRVLFGAVDWTKVDREILDKPKVEDKITVLRTAMLLAPGDPQGDVRLVKLLAQKGEKQEALAYGRRLRDRGFMTPTLALQLGDVLSDAGEQEEALRTYSEVVEFDGDNPASRRVLGDVYLRQGWYAAAYRQYKTLTDLDPKDATGWLRLARAAAGAGRVDEALRIEREVV